VSAEETCFAVANAEHPRRPDEPESITVSHVLVKHSGSKDAGADVTRSRGEACLRAMEARDKLRGGAPFEEIAQTYSDDKGVIGQVKRSDVLPPFADSAFELDRAQLSDVVETELGFHVILRTE
jgi:parvulin-like peptidyl-prolyl isomerase